MVLIGELKRGRSRGGHGIAGIGLVVLSTNVYPHRGCAHARWFIAAGGLVSRVAARRAQD